jgi:hypothetical protein
MRKGGEGSGHLGGSGKPQDHTTGAQQGQRIHGNSSTKTKAVTFHHRRGKVIYSLPPHTVDNDTGNLKHETEKREYSNNNLSRS